MAIARARDGYSLARRIPRDSSSRIGSQGHELAGREVMDPVTFSALGRGGEEFASGVPRQVGDGRRILTLPVDQWPPPEGRAVIEPERIKLSEIGEFAEDRFVKTEPLESSFDDTHIPKCNLG